MKKLTEGNIYKTFILYAIPLVLSGLLTQAYNLIDTMIAGKFLGEDGLAAIGATSQFITFMSSVFWGYINGFSVYIARLFGAGDYERIRRGIYMHIMICTAASFVVSALTVIFHEPLFDLLNVSEEIREDTFRYFSVYMAGFFLFHMITNGTLLLSALGDSLFPFIMSMVSAVMNIVGNILSVTVFGLGVFGIALSSVISAGAVSVLYMLRFSHCFKALLPHSPRIKPSFSEAKEGLAYTLPTILQQSSLYLSGFVLSPMINVTGSAAIASYVVTSQVLTIHNAVYQNSARTVSNYTAQCLGSEYEAEEKRRRLRRGVKVGALQGVLLVLVILIPCMVFPEFIASMFFSEGSSSESVALAVIFLRFFLPFVLFNVINNLFHSFFRGVKAMNLLVISTVFASAMRIAVSFPLTNTYGINGFYGGMVIAWILEAVFVLILYRSGIWMPKELKIKK